jgi:transposase InsO family protein
VRFGFIATEKAAFPVQAAVSHAAGVARRLLRLAGPPAGAARAGGRAARARDRDEPCRKSDRFGSPRIQAALADRGCRTSRKRVARLMRVRGWVARRRRRLRVTTQSRHPFPIAPNVLARQFERRRPDQAWVTDITYIPTGEGWLYLAVILDLCSRFAVGWAMSERITDDITLDALGMALARRRPPRACSIIRIVAVRQRRLPEGPGGARHRLQHEQPGQLLGQRRRRELFRHAEGRTRPRCDVGHAGPGARRAVRLSRALLQWAATPFGAWLPQPPAFERRRAHEALAT